MCCSLPRVGGFDVDFTNGAGTPALVQFGRRDPIISADRSAAVADALQSAGWQVTHRGYDMAHSQTIEMMVDAREWLAGLP
jgi:predicted esterase